MKVNIRVAVDNCIFTVNDGRLDVLLIQMKKQPFDNVWALPGGLMADGETLDAAAARILERQTGVHHVYLEQLYTFDSRGTAAISAGASPGAPCSSRASAVAWGSTAHPTTTAARFARAWAMCR